MKLAWNNFISEQLCLVFNEDTSPGHSGNTILKMKINMNVHSYLRVYSESLALRSLKPMQKKANLKVVCITPRGVIHLF